MVTLCDEKVNNEICKNTAISKCSECNIDLCQKHSGNCIECTEKIQQKTTFNDFKEKYPTFESLPKTITYDEIMSMFECDFIKNEIYGVGVYSMTQVLKKALMRERLNELEPPITDKFLHSASCYASHNYNAKGLIYWINYLVSVVGGRSCLYEEFQNLDSALDAVMGIIKMARNEKSD